MMYRTRRVGSFVFLVLLCASVTGSTVAAMKEMNNVVSRMTWKEKTAAAGLWGTVLVGTLNTFYRKHKAAKEHAQEAALYGSDEAFKKATEEVKNPRRIYYLLSTIPVLLVATMLRAHASIFYDTLNEPYERGFIADEQRLLAGPQDDAAKDDNADEVIHKARQSQLLGFKRGSSDGGVSFFAPVYVHLARPGPTEDMLKLAGHKDHRTMKPKDANIPDSGAWDKDYLEKIGFIWSTQVRFDVVWDYHQRLKKRIRRFEFILANYDQINTKLLRGGLNFEDQQGKTDEEVRDLLKNGKKDQFGLVKQLGLVDELTGMKNELKALEEALKR